MSRICRAGRRDFRYSRPPRRAWQALPFGSIVTQQDTDAGLIRTRIDGGFSFALAAFAIGLGLLALLERVGLPDTALKACVGALVFSEFLIAAALLRTMRPADFYAGTLPPPYAGLAYAGISAGLFLPFLPPLPQSVGFNSLAAGFAIGLLGAAFVTGPYLRHCGASSIADLAASRFPHPAARIAVAALAALCAALVTLGGYGVALRAFVAVTGASPALGVAVLGILLVLLIVPGGLSGVIWLAAGTAVVTLAALGLPLVLSAPRDTTPLSVAFARFGEVSGAGQHPPMEPAIVAALALGLATLAPLFGPALGSRDRAGTLRSGFFAFVFVGLIAALAALTMTRSTLALDAALVGRTPANLPADILVASGRGAISICGVHSAVSSEIATACGSEAGFDGILRLQDVGADARYLLEDIPHLRHAGPTLAGLAAVFAIALGVGVAAAGVQSFATSFGHDIFAHKRRRFGPASRRLAYARGLALLLIGASAAALANGADNPCLCIALALAVSAALVAPLVGLTVVKQATSLGALTALLVALFVIAASILTHRGPWAPEEIAHNAIFAALDAFLAGIFVSLLPRRKLPAASQEAREKPSVD
jgi:cation/acetate symporter